MIETSRRKILVFAAVALFFGAGTVTFIDGIGSSSVQLCRPIGLETAARVVNAKLVQLEKSDDFSIGSETKIFDDNGRILFYVFDLNPRGYVVTSADFDLPPVIVYSFTSNFSGNGAHNILLNMLKSDIRLRYEGIPYLPECVIESRNLLWNVLMNEKTGNLGNGNFQQWPPEGATATGGWLETNWHQESPYNDFCPIDGNNGQRSVAGCPAIAMAQILDYHRSINGVVFNDSDDYYHNYDGNRYWIDDDSEAYDFPSFPELDGYLITLSSHYQDNISLTGNDKASLVFACGVAAQQVYGSEISGTFGVDQVYRAYLRFGIDGVELLDGDDSNLYGRMRMNMVDGLPVHLAVVTPDWNSGHNFIVDGYNTDNYYHLNFGWNGLWNGWYLLPDEVPYGLTVVEGAIVDIMNEQSGSDVYCDGKLQWDDAAAGNEVTANFTVKNVGEHGSLLHWEIIDYPEWGTWTFTPSSGGGLALGDDGVTVEVSVVAPDKKIRDFSGYVKIINKNNDEDFFILPVSLVTPVNNHPFIMHIEQLIQKIMYQFPILEKMLQIYPFLGNIS